MQREVRRTLSDQYKTSPLTHIRRRGQPVAFCFSCCPRASACFTVRRPDAGSLIAPAPTMYATPYRSSQTSQPNDPRTYAILSACARADANRKELRLPVSAMTKICVLRLPVRAIVGLNLTDAGDWFLDCNRQRQT